MSREQLYIRNGQSEEMALSCHDGNSLRTVFNLLCGRNGSDPNAERLSPMRHANYLAYMSVETGLYLGAGTSVALRNTAGDALLSEEIPEPKALPQFETTADT